MANRGLEALAAVPLFEGLSGRHLRHVRDLGDEAFFMKGASLVRQGDEGDTFFVLLEGQAKVVRGGKTINTLIPGDHFGEISLLDGGERTASVVADTPVTCLVIDRKKFTKALSKEPAMSKALLKSMAKMIRRTDRSLGG